MVVWRPTVIETRFMARDTEQKQTHKEQASLIMESYIFVLVEHTTIWN